MLHLGDPMGSVSPLEILDQPLIVVQKVTYLPQFKFGVRTKLSTCSEMEIYDISFCTT